MCSTDIQSIRPLSRKLLEKALKELGEEPERITEQLGEIRKWLAGQPHLRARNDDQHLITFLRGCKWRYQMTIQKIDNFYTYRTDIPEFFKNRDPLSEEITAVLKAGCIIPLSSKESYIGPKVIILIFNEAGVQISPITIFKVLFMSFDILMNDDDNVAISGFKLLCDFDAVHPGYMLQFTPTALKNFVATIQSLYPMRMKGIIGRNVPTGVNVLYNTIVKPFLNEKLRQRVSLKNEMNWEEAVGSEMVSFLPKEYGGEFFSLKEMSDEWNNKIVNYRNWFLEEENYICQEHLRPHDTGHSEYFGTEGLFRNLSVD
ncbi:hypothetical protein RI129_004823 [Pyrocoelia pectoralis]|uniref:CRAL-TRIO domain-containing protein n=1 Tax=Pyrocoelia pectoralis TaxID=417401 RepID=A0AAN7VHC2_9COLE